MEKNNNRKIICVACLFWLAPTIGQAQVYKWVDDNGTTHYSQQKPDKKKATQLKLPAQPKSLKTPEELRQVKEQARRQQVDQESAQQKASTLSSRAERQKSVSGGREDGSDASRCALARDVLNGSLVHSNGKPIDEYDIRVAKRDVKKFCH